MTKSYYNENDKFAAQWLRNLISAGLIAPGDVDDRSITDVRPDDLAGYTQCHFFAGIGGWSYAARLAGWPDDRRLWTGSCPCQPFSVAGKQEGQSDERHLWPVFFNLIRSCRPDVVMGEQVAAAVGKHWLDGVHSDLETIGYACGATVVPACAVDAPHRRERLWFVADTDNGQRQRPKETLQAGRDAIGCSGSSLADADQSGKGEGREQRGRQLCWSGGDPSHSDVANADEPGPQGRKLLRERPNEWSAWADSVGVTGSDRKTRRVKSDVRLLAHGVPARVGKLRAYGNAIVPQVAAEVIGAYLDARAA